MLVDENWSLDQLSEQMDRRDSFVWAHLDAPTSSEVTLLADESGFDQHAIEDALSAHERTKATRVDNRLFITLYASHLSESTDDTPAQQSRLVRTKISVFVTTHSVITVSQDADFDISPIRRRWEQSLQHYGAFGLVHAIIDVITDGHYETMEKLDEAIEALEDIVFSDHVKSRVVQMSSYRLRKELSQLHHVVGPLRDVMQVVMREVTAQYDRYPQLRGYYDDLYDHVLRANEWCESLRDMITSVFETNLSLENAHLNVVMKKLAGWAAVIAVPTAITGWFGQNVPYPGFANTFGFWSSVIAVVAATIGVWAVMKFNDWI